MRCECTRRRRLQRLRHNKRSSTSSASLLLLLLLLLQPLSGTKRVASSDKGGGSDARARHAFPRHRYHPLMLRFFHSFASFRTQVERLFPPD